MDGDSTCPGRTRWHDTTSDAVSETIHVPRKEGKNSNLFLFRLWFPVTTLSENKRGFTTFGHGVIDVCPRKNDCETKPYNGTEDTAAKTTKIPWWVLGFHPRQTKNLRHNSIDLESPHTRK